MIEVTGTGDFHKTTDFLRHLLHGDIFTKMERYGEMGVEALSAATPERTGLTAHSWGYRVIKSHKKPGIVWYNSNIVDGYPVAILIQYGHATGTGGHVDGIDFVNPAMRPVFDIIAEEIWKKVKSS